MEITKPFVEQLKVFLLEIGVSLNTEFLEGTIDSIINEYKLSKEPVVEIKGADGFTHPFTFKVDIDPKTQGLVFDVREGMEIKKFEPCSLLSALAKEAETSESGMAFISNLDDLASYGACEADLECLEQQVMENPRLSNLIESRGNDLVVCYSGLNEVVRDLCGRVRPSIYEEPRTEKLLNKVSILDCDDENLELEHCLENDAILSSFNDAIEFESSAFIAEAHDWPSDEAKLCKYYLVAGGEAEAAAATIDALIEYTADFKTGVNFSTDKHGEHLIADTFGVDGGTHFVFHRLDDASAWRVCGDGNEPNLYENNPDLLKVDFYNPTVLQNSEFLFMAAQENLEACKERFVERLQPVAEKPSFAAAKAAAVGARDAGAKDAGAVKKHEQER